MFCPRVYSPFSIAITSLGEERVGLAAFRVFVCFAFVSLSSSSWCQGLAVTCDCGSPLTVLFTFFYDFEYICGF